jgi:hypothetical protein
MSTITVARTDVTVEEVAAVLRDGLGSEYNVLPGVAVNVNPFGGPRAGHPDTIVIGTGSNRLFRAQVSVSRGAQGTTLHVLAGGIGPAPRLASHLRIIRPVDRVLRAAPSLK